ncbi:MAG: hypothetical protein IJQ21_10975 [Lachnospiraceae bacterium]|nr:hypothetical protein [Lachnospiraceae bacterium]
MRRDAAKGTFGYIRASRTRAMLRTAVVMLVCVGLFLFGRITTGTNRNLFSIVAAVMCLPVGLSAVNMIMFFRAKPCSEAAYRAIESARGSVTVLYDLTLTGDRGDFAIAAACALMGRVLCYTEDRKLPVHDAVHHIKMQMSLGKYHDLRIGILKDIEAFCEALREADDARAKAGINQTKEEAEWQPGTPQTMTGILRSISL